MASGLRIGIVGVNAAGGWARDAHIPAVQALDGIILAAVAASSQQSADEAAHAFGVERAYAGGLALIADPDIDVVTVATRVPDHRDLLLAAIAAGKHVYSEWPLARGSVEAEPISQAAQSAGGKHAIGLQLRESPVVKRAREIIASGALGRVLGVSAVSTTAGFGPEVPSQLAYLEEPGTFANMITIQGAHTLDLLIALGGGLDMMSALMSRQFPQIFVGDQREPRARVTFDHFLMQGRFTSGAPCAMEVVGGRKNETPFHLHVAGERGVLRLDGGAPRGVQSSRLSIFHNGQHESVDEDQFSNMPDAAVNVAGVYKALRDDIVHGTSTVTDFAHAARLTRLIEDAMRSSVNGARIGADRWPLG